MIETNAKKQVANMNETLIIRLMSRCNCDCIFCCVREEIANSQDFPLDLLKAKVLEHSSDTPVDLFGGEPTLYPHFLEALSFIRKRGHPVTIATNSHRFSDQKFTNKISSMGISQIRTSLYGHTEELHEFHTRRKNSFKQTVHGIANILDAGIELVVNTVITKENVLHLSEIVQFLHGLGVQRIKFGSLVNVEHCHAIVPRMDLVRPNLTKALENSEKLGQIFAVEKSPFCLASKYQHIFVSEQDEYLYKQTAKCQTCGLFKNCVGIPKDHFDLYGDEFTIPFPKLKHSKNILQAKENRNKFISWNDDVSSFITLIIKTIEKCNLACDYCYESQNLNKADLVSQELIDMLVQRLRDSHYGRIDFNWHGGEPLICGQDIYEYAFSQQKKLRNNNSNRMITNRFQTNSLLVNDKWCEFFTDHNVEVSISLDGPEFIHNSHRFYHNQQGSFNHVMKAIERLSKMKVPFSILCVVTIDSIPFVVEIYNFFRDIVKTNTDLIRHIDFLPCYKVNEGGKQLNQLSLPKNKFADFMIQLFDFWFADDDTAFCIPFFEEIIAIYLGRKANLCNLKRGCKSFITIQPNGDAYPCDYFEGIPEFRLGNIFAQSFVDMFQSQAYQRYLNQVVAYPTECIRCEWFRVCQGGCAYESFLTRDVNYFCSDYMRIYDHIDSALSNNSDDYIRYGG